MCVQIPLGRTDEPCMHNKVQEKSNFDENDFIYRANNL